MKSISFQKEKREEKNLLRYFYFDVVRKIVPTFLVCANCFVVYTEMRIVK